MSIKYDENKVPYIDLGGGYQVRLETEEIDDDLYKEKAASELRESPENMKQGMMELRELLSGKHLQFIRKRQPKTQSQSIAFYCRIYIWLIVYFGY